MEWKIPWTNPIFWRFFTPSLTTRVSSYPVIYDLTYVSRDMYMNKAWKEVADIIGAFGDYMSLVGLAFSNKASTNPSR